MPIVVHFRIARHDIDTDSNSIFMYAIAPYRQHQRRTRILAVGFVLLYALASGRSLIPGMCATQSAMNAEGASFASAECCARPEAPFSNHNSDGDPNSANQSRCAFCQLALAAYTTTPYAANGAEAQLETPCDWLHNTEAIADAPINSNVGRDPPSPHLS